MDKFEMNYTQKILTHCIMNNISEKQFYINYPLNIKLKIKNYLAKKRQFF